MTFHPKRLPLPVQKILISVFSASVICIAFQTHPYIYVLLLGMIGTVIGWYIWAQRKEQILEHSHIKVHGLNLVWHYQPDLQVKYNSDEFVLFWEAILCKDAWRESVADVLEKATWSCVVDTFSKPYRLRWILSVIFPKEWTEDEKLAFNICVLSSTPIDQGWSLQKTKNGLDIRTSSYITEIYPKTINDVPVMSIRFWAIFQRDFSTLIDIELQYATPRFTTGLTEDIEFETPATFSLAEGGTLVLNQLDDGTYQVQGTSKTGVVGAYQHYATAEDFWWVWRNAIEQEQMHKMDASRMEDLVASIEKALADQGLSVSDDT